MYCHRRQRWWYTFTVKYLQCFSLPLPGPFKINACPLRRISQNFVIATSTKLDISSVKLPATVNDKYFKRSKQKRAKKVEGDIFSTKKEVRKKTFHTVHLFLIYIYNVATDYGLDCLGSNPRWGRDFLPILTGPGAHPASCTMGTGYFPGVKCSRGVPLTTHPLLVPQSWKSKAIPLPILWASNGITVPFLYIYIFLGGVSFFDCLLCL